MPIDFQLIESLRIDNPKPERESHQGTALLSA
jgi:hypothetical protein